MRRDFLLYAIVVIVLQSSISVLNCIAQPNDATTVELLEKRIVELQYRIDSLDAYNSFLQTSINRMTNTPIVFSPWDVLSDEDPKKKKFYDASVNPERMIEKRLQEIDFRYRIPYNETLRNYLDFYTIKRDKQMKDILKKFSKYEKDFKDIFQKHNIPTELTALCIVESACNPKAYSYAGAAGMWQLMEKTAMQYGLVINSLYDERLDPTASAEAAAKFLSDAFSYYKDWRLAIASYNCGQARVDSAIRKAGTRDYWSVSSFLPKETQGYLPSLIAVLYYIKYHA